jgi:hypothetical protein
MPHTVSDIKLERYFSIVALFASLGGASKWYLVGLVAGLEYVSVSDARAPPTDVRESYLTNLRV